MDSTILFKGKDLFLSERTIHHYHRLLFTVVKDAVYDNILQENIMLKVRLAEEIDTKYGLGDSIAEEYDRLADKVKSRNRSNDGPCL